MNVWILVFLFSPSSPAHVAVVIDNLPNAAECQRIAKLLSEMPHLYETSHRCIQYTKETGK